jgi:serine/threonine protein kinase/WD40 repeat protein
MTSDEPTSNPLTDEGVHVAFLQDLDAATDAEQVVHDYIQRHPHLADELRAMAEMRGALERSTPCDDDAESQPARLGDFRIVRRIARGGMGEIYEAIQQPLGRRVAVKTIRGQNRHLTGLLHERFLREQRVLAQLHHTHIVPIHAAGREGALQYFAMSYIDGAALHDVVRTARLHGSSSARDRTPTLAILAAEARSRLSGELRPDAGDKARANSHPERLAADESTSVTGPFGEPPRAQLDHQDAAASSTGEEIGNGKLILSAPYLRSVARVMIDAAEALQHAHDAGIMHRDLKPANLMVDIAEHCWVLDFGLAGYLEAQAQSQRPAGDGSPAHAVNPLIDLGPNLDPPTISGVLGTPDYMAPEQFRGRADNRTDVWGLGVILYELLTLRRPFHGRAEIETSDPPRLSDVVHNLPRDLEAICAKAIAKEPAKRYPRARDLADDLRHWLMSEPVAARPAHTPRRALLWAKRNKGWSAAIGIAVASLVTIAVGGVLLGKRTADLSHAEAQTLRVELQAKERELQLLAIQRLRMEQRSGGWSDQVRSLVMDVVPRRDDPALQAQAAAALAGIDARQVKAFDFEADAVAFDPSGRRLLLASGDGRVRIWDSATEQTQILEPLGIGELAFRPDGTAVQLVLTQRKRSLELRDLAQGRLLRTFNSPVEGASVILTSTITPDARLVAAIARRLDASGQHVEDAGVLAVWESDSGRLVRSISAIRATAVALSPDGTLLAAGDENGRITVRQIPRDEVIATLEARRNRVNCLRFGADPLRRRDAPRPGTGWLLAAGESGGIATVWDLHTGAPRSSCRGSSYEVYALAFRPDGMTLASASEGRINLWDVATGRLLLGLDVGYMTLGLAFSPSGDRLAAGSSRGFTPDGAHVWKLEDHRGIETLRGLLGPVEKVLISADGRLVAALSDDWQVAIWDRSTGRLLHLLDPPRGSFADNAALAFDPEGRRFANASGHEAILWDIATGKALNVWRLPEGFQDNLVFRDEQLLSIRVETQDERVPPYGTSPINYPRVVAARNLLGPNPARPIWELHEFDRHMFHSAVSPDGRYFMAEGLRGPSFEKRERVVKLFDARTGKPLASVPTELPLKYGSAWFRFDPTGSVLAHLDRDDFTVHFLAIPDLTYLAELPPTDNAGLRCLGPRGTRWLVSQQRSGKAIPSTHAVHERARKTPFVTIAGDQKFRGTHHEFSRDGRLVAWCNADGTVSVLDLVESQRRLAEVGLGW